MTLTEARTASILRVTIFDPYAHVWGGSHQVTAALAEEYLRRGVAVEYLTVQTGPLTERLTDLGLPWSLLKLPPALMVYGRSMGRLGGARAAAALPTAWCRTARRLRGTADVLHINNLRGVLLLGPAARLTGLPTVWHVHQPDANPILNRFAASLATAIVVPNEGTMASLPGVSQERVTVIPNGTPWAALQARVRRGDVPTIVTAARIMPDKGLNDLIAALGLVRARIPNARLVVFGAPQVGYETYATELHRQIQSLGLADAVTFAGQVNAPWREWGEAWVYAQPSRQENFGLAVLEAMASGLPVVATDVGGLRSLVRPPHNGLLVSPEDPADLASALLEILSDSAAADRMGEHGRKMATGEFSMSTTTHRFLELYARMTA